MFKYILYGAVVYTSPIWGGILLSGMGRMVNRRVEGESGIISKINPYEFNYNNYENTMFEDALSSSGVAPWSLMFPPATIFPFANVIKGIIGFPIHVLTIGTK